MTFEALNPVQVPAIVLTRHGDLDKLDKLRKFHFCIHKMMVKAPYRIVRRIWLYNGYKCI